MLPPKYPDKTMMPPETTIPPEELVNIKNDPNSEMN